MIVAITGIILGAISALLDLGNRLFGSYARTLGGSITRVLLVTAICLGLLSPLAWFAYDPSSATAAIATKFFGGLGAVVFFHFLFPLRHGFKRERPPGLRESTRRLTGSILLREFVVELPVGLPSPDRLTVLVLTDLHCNTRRKLEALDDALNAASDVEHDLVLVLGDFGENVALLPEVMARIAHIPNRRGIFAVRGNHDCEGGRAQLIANMANSGMLTLLSNATVEPPGTGITLLGVELPWVPGLLATGHGKPFAIGLTHTPDNLPELSRIGVPLVLAGHTHGGHLRLPLVGNVLLPSWYGRFLDCGWFRYDQTWMYLSPGIGYHPTAHNRGEIVRLTIIRSQADANTGQAEPALVRS